MKILFSNKKIRYFCDFATWPHRSDSTTSRHSVTTSDTRIRSTASDLSLGEISSELSAEENNKFSDMDRRTSGEVEEIGGSNEIEWFDGVETCKEMEAEVISIRLHFRLSDFSSWHNFS